MLGLRLVSEPRLNYNRLVPEGYITTTEAAERLGTTLQAVQKLIKRGRIVAEKFGPVWMIREDALDGFKKSNRGRKPKVAP